MGQSYEHSGTGHVPLHGSHADLARSIARVVLDDLPGEHTPADLERSVDGALRTEARNGEVILARSRLVAVALATLLALLGVLVPGAGSLGSSWSLVALGVAWTTLSAVLMVRLRRGWYRRGLRLVVPAVDGLFLAGAFLLTLTRAPSSSSAALFTAALLIVLATFASSLRMSRSATRLSTAVGLALWLLVSIAGPVPLVPSIAGAVAVLLAGLTAYRVHHLVRRLVTDQIRSSRLEGMYRTSQEALQAREQVLEIVSHDLRNPLGAISMAAKLMLEMPLSPEQKEEQIQIIDRCGDRMNRMVQDLLDATRIASGTLSIEPARVEVSDILDDVDELMRPLAEQQGIEFVVRGADDLPGVRADRARIEQVLSNLVGNAIKFTPDGGRITVEASRMGRAVRVSVRDTGPGIPPEVQPNLFKRLWQADPHDHRGLGLGLGIARSIIEAHEERIDVDSRPGQGAEFWFTLRMADEPRT